MLQKFYVCNRIHILQKYVFDSRTCPQMGRFVLERTVVLRISKLYPNLPILPANFLDLPKSVG